MPVEKKPNHWQSKVAGPLAIALVTNPAAAMRQNKGSLEDLPDPAELARYHVIQAGNFNCTFNKDGQAFVACTEGAGISLSSLLDYYTNPKNKQPEPLVITLSFADENETQSPPIKVDMYKIKQIAEKLRERNVDVSKIIISNSSRPSFLYTEGNEKHFAIAATLLQSDALLEIADTIAEVLSSASILQRGK